MEHPIQNRVKELRVQRDWTQQQLADAVGVSRQSINSIERNRYVPSLSLALTFARVFACSTDDIFTLENPEIGTPHLDAPSMTLEKQS
jgi:putative transcriptional regulator